MNILLKPLPINQFAFEKIRSEKMIYVDKTQLIYNMISNPDYYFFIQTATIWQKPVGINL